MAGGLQVQSEIAQISLQLARSGYARSLFVAASCFVSLFIIVLTDYVANFSLEAHRQSKAIYRVQKICNKEKLRPNTKLPYTLFAFMKSVDWILRRATEEGLHDRVTDKYYDIYDPAIYQDIWEESRTRPETEHVSKEVHRLVKAGFNDILNLFTTASFNIVEIVKPEIPYGMEEEDRRNLAEMVMKLNTWVVEARIEAQRIVNKTHQDILTVTEESLQSEPAILIPVNPSDFSP